MITVVAKKDIRVLQLLEYNGFQKINHLQQTLSKIRTIITIVAD